MQTRNYETVFITRQDLTEARLNELNTKLQQIVEAHKGKVLTHDNWGKRKFSYPIDKEARGNYTFLLYSGDNAAVAELERNMRISDDVLRFITVKLDDRIDPLKNYTDFKARLAAQAQRAQERQERDREERAARGGDEGGGRRGGFRGGDRGDRGGFDRGDRGGFDRGDRGGDRNEAAAPGPRIQARGAAPAAASEEEGEE